MARNDKKEKVTSMLKDRTEDMKAGLQKTGKDMKAGVNQSVDKSRKAIQKRPLTAVGVAAGAAVAAGLIAGAVITQKRKDAKKKR